MSAAYVIGYDPGGKDAHGVAALEVVEDGGRWKPIALHVTTTRCLADAVVWLDESCRNGRFVAAGIDTLTQWNSGEGGWRHADFWLRQHYPVVANSVVSPNYLSGSMAVNGAAFLMLLAARFRADRTMVTEAHPKVCYFAMTGRRHAWVDEKSDMIAWLFKELAVDERRSALGDEDHPFDAGVALMTALRGVNGDWTLDLHAVNPATEASQQVRFCGKTHFWWPGIDA